MKRLLAMASTMLILVACANKEKNADATGTFEATETVLSAEQNGTLLEFQVSEADNISPGQEPSARPRSWCNDHDGVQLGQCG